MKPQISLARQTTPRMWIVSLAAFLAVLQSSLADSFSSLVIAIAAIGAAFVCEFIIYFRTGKSAMIKDGSSIASALTLTLLLPNSISPVYAVIGAIFAMIVVKYSFGGLGANWVNPALGGWLFVRFSWNGVFEQAMTPAIESNIIGVFGDSFIAEPVANFLNNTIFSLTGTELPIGYLDIFGSRSAAIIADRGLLALLLGTIIIVASQTIRVWVPVIYLAVYGAMVKFFGGGDVLTAFLSGGTIAVAFFLLPEPVTGPKSSRGACICALFAGVFTFIFRYPSGELYGAFFAVALLNAIVPLVRSLESRLLYKGSKGSRSGE
ncbi:MAG: RnfABCDGE type electron transport complex subunit D [Treponema sp.]|nr:RnfABCDGE type electron transport complex subunit D [Treponema sp.]